MTKLILTCWATLIAIVSFGQTIKTMKPTVGAANNYTKQEQALWQAVAEKNIKLGDGSLRYDDLSDAEKKLMDSLDEGYGPITEGPGCSWYCGGQMYKVTGDSYLKASGSATYKPDNLHDFDLFTAWVPDTTNGVIGKKVNFHFKPLSPRVNEIKIYNGYIKNYDLFKANARVKKFRLYINNKPFAILDLADTTAQQSFSIPPTRSTDKNKDLILTFEIMEIYKGDKYTDVAVSEINFSGVDVH